MKGTEKGEVCNRNGCHGNIKEEEKEGSCRCHINPPCSYCTTDTSYCPICEWSASDEHAAPQVKSEYDTYKVRTLEGLNKTKIDWINKGHTHFTMIKIGVYPIGTSRKEVFDVVKGTFGGKFKRFGNGFFEFVAQTD